MKPDPAVLSALDLPSDVTATVSYHGSSSFSSTFKLTTNDGHNYFLKTSNGPDAEAMFLGEYTSLNHIYAANPEITSKPIATGPLQSTGGHFLLTEFLDLTGASPSSGALAQKLAALHSAPAPKEYGFPVPTSCGDTVQDNTWCADWAHFFADRRLRAVLPPSADAELRSLVERTTREVVPRLLGGLDIEPSLVHGDLWAGNAAGAVVFDPSCCYAHSEYELGIMRLFGGFDDSFMHAYHRLRPKTPPEAEYEHRVELYALFHQLNHYRIFGVRYRTGAVESMRSLLARYGGIG